MKKKLLIGTIVVSVIAASFVFVGVLEVPALGVWIYLVWMVWKKKTNIFHDQMEPKLAERRYKMLKTSLLVAGISFAVGTVGVILHNVLYALSVTDDIFFPIAISTGGVFNIATIGGLYIFLKGRRKTT